MKYALASRYLLTPVGWTAVPLMCLIATIFPLRMGPAVLAFCLAVLLKHVEAHASDFDRGLPVHARITLEARLLAALGLMLLPVIAWAVSLHLQHPGAWPLARVLAVPCVMVMAAMIIYLSDGSPRRFASESFRLEVVARLIVLAAVVAAVVLTLPPNIALVSLLVIAAVMYRWLTANIPEAIQDAVSSPNRSAGADARQGETKLSGSLWWQMLRAGYPKLYLAIVFLIAVGSTFDGSLQLSVTLYVGLFMVAARPRMGWLSSLPLSHSARLRLMIIPLLTVGIGGTVIGAAAGEVFWPEQYGLTTHGQRTYTVDDWRQSPTRVSLTYWHTAPRHEQPVITAPWGERVVADTVSAFGKTRFNPYTARKSSSEQFVDWQFQRATEAVYGTALNQAEYNALPARDRPRSLMQRPAARVIGLALLLVLMLLSAWTFEAFSWHRAARLGKRSRYLFFALLLSPGMALLFLPRWLIGGRTLHADFVTMESLCLTLTKMLGNSIALSMLVAGVSVFLAWRLLLWQFTQSEFETLPAGSARPHRAHEPARITPLRNAA